ncbi:2Fe-2S iron-sulfur cluster-binding protein [Sphingomonas bacterium]|uniref:2Fe-2S iron-sulfur cluster-binding protein n=1 Tax=Sphingomonas bacterium TaxID=1895847 RepID=UPI00157511B8|nr:2Fe-2S iron-sulfur cluster-binding protein [Sphingomonas bacterium]
MTRIAFVGPDGRVTDADAATGARLLDVAQAAGQPLEGTCGGEMACATCHVLIDAADLASLPLPSAEEEDLLDLVPGARRFSRLACQIVLPAGLEQLTVRVPR